MDDEPSNDHLNANEPRFEENENEKPSTPVPSLKPSSRFNLRRPNQLLVPRGRPSPLSKAAATNADDNVANNSNNTSDMEKTPSNQAIAFEASKESRKH